MERSLLNQEEEPPREQSRWGALEGDPSFSKKKKKKDPPLLGRVGVVIGPTCTMQGRAGVGQRLLGGLTPPCSFFARGLGRSPPLLPQPGAGGRAAKGCLGSGGGWINPAPPFCYLSVPLRPGGWRGELKNYGVEAGLSAAVSKELY